MKRAYKFLAFVLLAGLLTVFLALESFAEASAPEILRVGAKFENSEISLTYSVKANASDKLKLTVWSTYPISGTEAIYETEAFTELSENGASYKVFSSQNILMQNLRKPYYAQISAVSEDGTVLSKSEISKFSVFDYFLELLGTGTKDQIALFTRLLDLGASMQRYLLGTSAYSSTELSLSGGYSDEYYALKTNIFVDGVLKDSTVDYYNAPTSVRLTAEKVLDGAAFAGFATTDGTPLKEYGELTSPSWNEYPYELCNVGITEISLSYTAGGAIPASYDKTDSISALGVTFDSGTKPVEPAFRAVTKDKKGVSSTTRVANSAHLAYTSKGTENYLGFFKTLKALADTTYTNPDADKSGAYKAGDIIGSISVSNCGMALPADKAFTDAKTHVFETDLYVYSPNNGICTYVNLLDAEGNAFWGFNISAGGKGATFSLTVRGGADDGKSITEGITLRQRDWYNLRVEYDFDADAEIRVFLDGKLVTTYTVQGTAAAEFSKAYFYHADSFNNVTLKLDNTIITSAK